MQSADDEDAFVRNFCYLQYEDTENTSDDSVTTTPEDDSISEENNAADDLATTLDSLTVSSANIADAYVFADEGTHGNNSATSSNLDDSDDESYSDMTIPDFDASLDPDPHDECSKDGYSDSTGNESSLGRPLYATGSLLTKVRIPSKFHNRRIYAFDTMLVIKLKNGCWYDVGDLFPPPEDQVGNLVNILFGLHQDEATVLTQHIKLKTIDRHWIFLDSQPTIDLFCSKDLLRNIRSTSQTMRARGTRGVETTNTIGDLPGYGSVWFKENGLANISSLARVSRIDIRVTYNSDNKNCFMMHRPDSHDLHFCQSSKGLFYYDTRHLEFYLIHTVEQNKSLYTERQVKQVDVARRLYAMIGRPSPRDFEDIARLNIIPGCPTTINDINISNKIFGHDIGALKGKTTRRKPRQVRSDVVFVPPELVKIHKDVILCMDVMFVNGLPFFATISRNLKFSTIQFILNRTHVTLCSALPSALFLY